MERNTALVIVGLTIAASLGGYFIYTKYTYTQTPTARNGDTETYINDEWGISFSYPKGWYYEVFEANDALYGHILALYFYKSDEVFWNEGSETYGVAVFIEEYGGTLENALKENDFYQRILDYGGDPQLGYLTVDGKNAVTLLNYELLVVHDNKLVTLYIDTRPDPSIKSAQDVFQRIYSTLVFSK